MTVERPEPSGGVMQTQDAEVISRFLDGDKETVEIVDSWIRRSAQPYRRRLESRWDDVLQDLRLKVTQLLQQERFQGRSSLKTYLRSVVSHACLNEIRAAEKWHWTDLETLEQRPGGYSKAAGSLAAAESKGLLLRILQQTSAHCRDLWSMIFEGFSYSEMSERLGVSSGTLRVRVLRCRKRALELRDQVQV